MAKGNACCKLGLGLPPLSRQPDRMTTSKFKTAAILGNSEDARVSGPMLALIRFLEKNGLNVLLSRDNGLPGQTERASLSELADRADLFIAIGGDGTLLSSAAHALTGDIPLLGINRGRLGFLTDIRPAEMEASVGAVLTGNYTESKRALLSARLQLANGDSVAGHALNDVVLTRQLPGRMIDFTTYVDDHFVNDHAGDGLIAATPTGSTAYALSCGGPIMQPGLDAIALVPICPHTLSDRPIVLPGSVTIRVEVHDHHGVPGEVTCDGQTLGPLGEGDTLVITAARERITLLHPPGYDYFELLRSKLNWGRSERHRGNPDR